MPYLECPRCHAEFRTGLIYEPLEACPRCGQPLGHPSGPSAGKRRGLLRRRPKDPAPDWEAITGAQYGQRQVTRPSPGSRDGTAASA
jgi:hypothetical protein